MEIVWQAEDSLREKKLENDTKDLLKTLVAFANSVAPGDTARIFIGERDDGTIQGVSNPDDMQKRVRKEAEKIFPEIDYKTTVYGPAETPCVLVEIRSNRLAPHFGGAAWVRRGSETIRATEHLYRVMVETKLEKVSQLLQWQRRPDKNITIEGTWRRRFPEEFAPNDYSVGQHRGEILDVNSHWLSLRRYDDLTFLDFAEPLIRIALSWDYQNKRPQVVVLQWDYT